MLLDKQMLLIIIDRVAGAIIRLVVSVSPFVCGHLFEPFDL